MAATDGRTSLEATQRELWRVIVAPEGVASSQRPAGQGVALEAIVRGDELVSVETRVGVYANAYFERIHGCLASDFPALATALGEAAFRDLATSYLAVHPPQHFSLRYAGARLPRFLEKHAAAAPFRSRWPWCADLARLECAIGDVFDAPDSPVVRREDLSELAPERWAELELAPIPAHRLLAVGWPVHDLRRSYEAGRLADGSPGAPPDGSKGSLAAQSATLCVWREAERVFHRELGRVEAVALAATSQGASFGELCELAERELGGEQAAAEAAGWLARWLADGLLSSASIPTPPRG